VKARELLETVDLSEKGDKQAKTYSGGMKRKLCVAMALMGDPKGITLKEINKVWHFHSNLFGRTIFWIGFFVQKTAVEYTKAIQAG
jgi:ABC-type histidine transport system ATPase subunit